LTATRLHPFFGVRSIPREKTRLFLGSSPDYRGSTNVCEAVHDVVAGTAVAADDFLHGRGDGQDLGAASTRRPR
jgi:hypothetical protein